MRKIVVPTDFSDNAMNALKYALELFKNDICEFFILHAYQDEIYADNALLTEETLGEITTIISNRTQLHLEDTLKDIKEMSPNPKHTYHSVASNSMLMDETERLVDEENIDIVVMGTRGKTNDRNLTFGSHTLQVLKYIKCPVLAIPEHYKYSQPKHILFPTDYMVPYKRRELKLLCEMASSHRAKIDMIYISKSDKLSMRQKDNQSFIREELCKNQIAFSIINSKNVTNAIYTHIKEHETDMLVMINTRHSFLENILFQSRVDKMSLYLDIPFLALQNIRRH